MKSKLALALGGWSAVAACSLLVPSELEDIDCRDEGSIGPPACRPAELCARGSCTPCQSREACLDRIDNDCNGLIDDGCPAGGSDAGPDAPAGGDAEADADAGRPPAALGETCAVDSDCQATAFCAAPSALGLSGTSFCTHGCCTSADCGASPAVCFPTAGGASLCVPADRVGRPAPGELGSGSDCLNARDCRSAWCGAAEGVCLDTCCRNSDCTALTAPDCTLRDWSPPGARSFGCADATGTRAYQDSCFGSLSCRSSICASGVTSSFCTQACCTASDCGGTLECRYSAASGSPLRVCEPSGVEGNLEVGEPCGSDADCRSAWCLTQPSGGNLCSDTCCRDPDCGDTARFACRLGQSGERWVLRCEPR